MVAVSLKKKKRGGGPKEGARPAVGEGGEGGVQEQQGGKEVDFRFFFFKQKTAYEM